MNCKICGAELKKDGELCNNCMNKLMKEQQLRNDKAPKFTFRSKFMLGYELLRHIEQIGVAIFAMILALSVDFGLWKYVVIAACLFVIYEICYLIYLKFSISAVSCTMYRTKLNITRGIFRKKVKEIPYSEIEEISYTQGNMNKVFNNGNIVIKRNTRNLMERTVCIEAVKNVEDVFEKIKEIYN